MKAFTTLTSIAAPLLRDNVDTDAIIPSREMKSTGKSGLANGLFAPWRYLDADARTPNPEFVLNDPVYKTAQILLGGINFGCGSSREHAVWALAEYGLRCIIAESFAPIFENNCIRNGVLPITLPKAVIATMAGKPVSVDLAAQTVICDTNEWTFDIGDEAKSMLLEGLDAIDMTLKHRDRIADWQTADRSARPWIYFGSNPPHKNGEGDHVKHGGGVKSLPAASDETVMRAKKLRRNMSKPEVMLWQELRKKPQELKFRRQHPAGPFVLDFYCAKAKLDIEIDGNVHSMGNNPQKDAKRDLYLLEHGIETIRFPAKEVMDNVSGVVAEIVKQARARLPLHHPADGPPPQAKLGEDL